MDPQQHGSLVKDRLGMLIEKTLTQAMAYQIDARELTQAVKIKASLLPQEMPDDVVYFLDGYHVIESKALDKAITFLLEKLPVT